VNYSSAVGAGFYGNEELNKGLQHFIEAAEDVRETIQRTESQVSDSTLHERTARAPKGLRLYTFIEFLQIRLFICTVYTRFKLINPWLIYPDFYVLNYNVYPRRPMVLPSIYLLWIASFTAVMTVGRFSSKLKSFLSTHTAYSFTVCLLAASSMLKFLMWCNVNKCIKSLIRTFVRPLQMLSSMLQHDFKIQEPLLLQRNRATRYVS